MADTNTTAQNGAAHEDAARGEQMLEETRGRVRGFLQAIYPDFAEFSDGTFTIQEGTAIVSITVRPWHEGDTAVEFTSQLVSGAKVDEKLMRWLLEKNVELHFGALGILFDNTIVYSQTLPGCDLSEREFQATARTVATIADHYDGEIIAMSGGKTAAEAFASDAAERTQ